MKTYLKCFAKTDLGWKTQGNVFVEYFPSKARFRKTFSKTRLFTTTLASYVARLKNGAARFERRPIFGFVVLNFESVFLRNLLELLAELLAKFSVGLARLTFLFESFFHIFFE